MARDSECRKLAEHTKGRIAFWAVIIYLGTPALVMVVAVLGFSDLQTVKEFFVAWHGLVGWLVAATVTYYFGTK